MKYCPKCGADLPGSAVSFCPECGKKLSTPTQKQKKRPTEKKSRSRKKDPPPQEAQADPMDENYDGYYDDVQPIDAGERGEGLDPELLKRIGLIVLGAVGVIALAIVLMTLL